MLVAYFYNGKIDIPDQVHLPKVIQALFPPLRPPFPSGRVGHHAISSAGDTVAATHDAVSSAGHAVPMAHDTVSPAHDAVPPAVSYAVAPVSLHLSNDPGVPSVHVHRLRYGVIHDLVRVPR